MDKFKYLKPALIFILFFVGVKMLASHHVHLPEWTSLAVIILALTTGIFASLKSSNSDNEKEP
jgi:tellurite resistance protein TerC